MSLKTSFYLSVRNQDYLQRLPNGQPLSLAIESYSFPLIDKYKKKQNQKQGYHKDYLYLQFYFYYITSQPPRRDSHPPETVHGPPTKIKIKTSKYSSTTSPLCPLLPPNCCRLAKKIECKLFFNYWKPILINLAVYLPKYTVYYLLLFTIVATAAN